MNKPAILILCCAAALGILGDAWLRATPWGLNALLWLLVAAAAAFAVKQHAQIEVSPRARWLIAMGLFCATGLSWRDSAPLRAFNIVGIIFSLALAMAMVRGGGTFAAGLIEYGLRLLRGFFETGFGAFTLIARAMGQEATLQRASVKTFARAAFGVLLAMPLLMIFGGLFMAADKVFEELVSSVFDLEVDDLLVHGIVAAIIAWLSAGYLHGLLLREVSATPPKIPHFPSFGSIEVPIILALLNTLFLIFIVVQIQYFFGGESVVRLTPGITYAEYARRGFFELLAVSMLVLPLLLFFDWALGDAEKRTFRMLAGTLLVMVAIIMMSAVKRVLLYNEAYGLTEQRLYAMALMFWLGTVLAWLAATVLRGRRAEFLGGAIAAGFAVHALLHAINPDALIARTNVARIDKGHAFDAKYVRELSADAAPVLVGVLPRLSPEERTELTTHLRTKWAHAAEDWRTWNVGRAAAARLVGNLGDER